MYDVGPGVLVVVTKKLLLYSLVVLVNRARKSIIISSATDSLLTMHMAFEGQCDQCKVMLLFSFHLPLTVI
jgi:hypothetical protein